MKPEDNKSYFDSYAQQDFDIQPFESSEAGQRKWETLVKSQKTPEILSLACLRTTSDMQKTNALFLCGLFGGSIFFFD